MEFYERIEEVYDKIFPLNQLQKQFVSDRLPSVFSLLDLGCATGSLSLSLLSDSHPSSMVVGVDLSPSMIAVANERAEAQVKNAEFRCGDLMNMKGFIDPGRTFSSAVCLGNTLVHLNGIGAVRAFFRSVADYLSPGGLFIVQIINYDRICKFMVPSLPTIENESIRFERAYSMDENMNRVSFSTKLTVKDPYTVSEQAVELFPLRKADLETELVSAGFSELEWFGSFGGENFDLDVSVPLIVVAKLKNH